MKIAILAGILLALSTAAVAADLPAGPHIVTSGNATVEAIPDIATLSISVHSIEKNAAAAKNQVDDRVKQYLTFLQKNGVQQQDIQALNLRVQPNYDYQNGKTILQGYRAVRNVNVTVRKLDALNSLLDGALKAGLNDIQGVTPAVADPERYQRQAQQAAVANAISQARQLAADFNSTLGAVYSVRYHTGNAPMAVGLLRAQADTSAAQSTYEPSAISFSDQVDVVFEISPIKGQIKGH